ncbi:UNVERIFIED_CONTAM: hypothetical protein Scaly_2048700 [Sesamum calycinum]|uniref:Retrotransposon gag domain-containing protein n=1 Tax=Sesamum calycinum TaxID=2727403 RepID=A0AAW2N5L2_9LAMI
MKQQFLLRFFPGSRATHLRKEIYGIRQLNGESLYKYWERFKELIASYPHHQFTESLLIQYFYKGLSRMNRRMVDAASGGALIDKTPNEAQHLISTMAENYRAKARNDSLGDMLEYWTSNGRMPLTPRRVMPNVNTVGGFPRQPQRRYDPHFNFYYSGWRDHPNFSYRNQGEQSKPHLQPFNRPTPAPAQAMSKTPNSCMSLEDIVKSLALMTQQIQQNTMAGLQETREGLQHLGNQISQLATSVSKLEAQASGKLPSQTETNPRENVSAITLWSGKSFNQLDQHQRKLEWRKTLLMKLMHYIIRMPKSKEEEHEREIFYTFKKVEINIPLLNAIKQIPKYAKFLKELCTNKRKLKDKERIIFGKNVSAVINRKLPEKCKDPSRPFMKTAKTKIDVDKGTLSVEFGGEIVKFNISEAMKYPNELQALYQIDVIDSVVHDVVEELVGTELDLIMELDENDVEDDFMESLSEAPKLELKPLPEHLNYIYLGNEEIFSTIISSKLSKEHERDYYQIAIVQEDQEKTTFTYPFGTFAFRRMLFGLCNVLGAILTAMDSLALGLVNFLLLFEAFLSFFDRRSERRFYDLQYLVPCGGRG